MAWAVPKYPKKQVTAAGKIVAKFGNDITISSDDDLAKYFESLDVINNWRASHGFPLNTIQNGLRRAVRSVDSNYLVAQRIKRLSSITLKLSRYPTMSLAQMQDLGGCRAIVSDVSCVHRVVESYRKSNIKHKLHTLDDYILSPKSSGYRGVHIIFTYFSDRNDTYNGMKIEVQVRSHLQHAWATAVETVGTFVRQALKSSQGEQDWLRFFSLISSAIARREHAPIIPGTPSEEGQAKRELLQLADKLDVANKLKAYGAALRTLEDPSVKSAHYFLLNLQPDVGTVSVQGFKASELSKATDRYLEVEKSIGSQKGGEAVLVSVESLASLQRAYPNYFLDTDVFLDALSEALIK